MTVDLPAAGLGAGHMLLIARHPDAWSARFISPVGIYHCTGARTAEGGELLRRSYLRGGEERVRSLRRDRHAASPQCWLHAPRFCLSFPDTRLKRSMGRQIRNYAQSAGYSLIVFLGTALLGFVVAPWLGMAIGLFTIEAESSGFFSILTLKGVPYLVALSVPSGLLHPMFSGRRLRLRVVLFGLNILAVWLIGASIALAILG